MVVQTELCQLVNIVKESCGRVKVRSVRQRWKRLAIDCICIVCNLRPVVMLDYAVVQLDWLDGMLLEIRKCLQCSSCIGAFEFEGCTYLMGQGLKNLQQRTINDLLFVDVQNQLISIKSQIEDQKVLGELSGQLMERLNAFPAPAPSSKIVFPSCDFKLLPPSINGYLLGYPVIYYITNININEISQYLSQNRLRKYTVVAKGGQFGYLFDGGRSQSGTNFVEGELFSFCVPKILLGDEFVVCGHKIYLHSFVLNQLQNLVLQAGKIWSQVDTIWEDLEDVKIVL